MRNIQKTEVKFEGIQGKKPVFLKLTSLLKQERQ